MTRQNTRSIRVRDITLRLAFMDTFVSTDVKVALANRIVHSGIPAIELSSFVSAEYVPGLADAELVFAKVDRVPGVSYECCVASMRGLRRAIDAGVDTAWFLFGASDFLNERNIGRNMAGALDLVAELASVADSARLKFGSYLIGSFGDPWSGPRGIPTTASFFATLKDRGAGSVIVADSFGFASPRSTVDLLECAASVFEIDDVNLQVHDSRGMGIANAHSALAAGFQNVDASLAGSGSHPAMGELQVGGISTEDLVQYAQLEGLAENIDLSELIAAANDMAALRPDLARGFVRHVGAVPRKAEDATSRVPDFSWPLDPH